MSAPPDPNLADVDQVTFANMERHDERARVCPDWRKETVTSDGWTGLTNEVHPLFRDHLFTGFNLEETLLARQFATRLLDADCCLRFWCTLVYSEPWHDPKIEEREAKAAAIRMLTHEEMETTPKQDVDSAVQALLQAKEPNRVLGFFDPPPSNFNPEGPTPGDKLKTMALLCLLSRHIRYTTEETAGSSRCDTNWLEKASHPFRGSPSNIVISLAELRTHSSDMQGDLVCKAWASVSLGFKLLQLLAHAYVGVVYRGARCNWTNEYRFDADQCMGAEIRMLESCTFGGVLRREQETEQVPKAHYTIDGTEGVPGLWIAFSDYPSADMDSIFGTIADGTPYDAYLPQEDGPFYHREWQVPFKWFLWLLTDTT